MNRKLQWFFLMLVVPALLLFAALAIAQTLPTFTVEPNTLSTQTGGLVTIYATGGVTFTEGSTVRLLGRGILPTVYVNPTALQATVPAGLAAGTYELRVLDSQGLELGTGSLTLTAPPATPHPTSIPTQPPPPPSGRPILTIRNYSVTPDKVRVGGEFVVAIEIYNNGSRAGENTLAIFPGGTFLPVGEQGHTLWALQINHTVVVTQQMRVPSSLSSGVYQLQVNLSANDFEGNHYDYPQAIPVEVTGGSSGTYTGKPKVIIEGAETDPATLIPGEPFSLTLRLANRGNRTAINVFAACASPEMAIPASGGDTVSTAKIAIDDVVTLTLPLIVGNVEQGGRQRMIVALEYGDYGGGTYSDQQNIGVDVNTTLNNQPQLLIEEYDITPDFLAPGDPFTLTLHVTNVGGGAAQRLMLSFGGEGGASLAPFIAANTGNVRFVPQVPPGQMVDVVQQLIVDGTADPKSYSLPISLNYDDLRGTRHSDTQQLSLIVRRIPELQASFYRQPDVLMVGVPVPLSMEVANVGRSLVDVVDLQVTSQQLELQEQESPLVGPTESGASIYLDLLATPQESGTAEVLASITYRDSFNRYQTITKTLEIEVMENPEGTQAGTLQPGMSGGEEVEEQPETFWGKVGRFFKGLLGLGS